MSESNNPQDPKSCPTGTCPVHKKSTAENLAPGCTSDFSTVQTQTASHGYLTDVPQTTFIDDKIPLSNIVISSSIPKGGSDKNDNWQYPSPQRFFNAMKKKGYNPRSEDMQTVVSIHNTVNEKCWKNILEYEKYHLDECPTPKLLKFRGRPDDLSPKAMFMSFIGYEKPFDRHDWIVDRCGKQVRYILDFYRGTPSVEKPVSIHIDVRPEVSVEGVIDRLRKQFFD